MTRQQRTSKGPPRDPVPRLQCLLNSHCCGDLLAAHYQRHPHRHCHCLHNILSARSLTFYYLNDVPLIIVSNSGIKEGHFLVSMWKICYGDLDYGLYYPIDSKRRPLKYICGEVVCRWIEVKNDWMRLITFLNQMFLRKGHLGRSPQPYWIDPPTFALFLKR